MSIDRITAVGTSGGAAAFRSEAGLTEDDHLVVLARERASGRGGGRDGARDGSGPHDGAQGEDASAQASSSVGADGSDGRDPWAEAIGADRDPGPRATDAEAAPALPAHPDVAPALARSWALAQELHDPTPATPVADWEAVLTELERDVESARAMLDHHTGEDAVALPPDSALAGTWTPPTGLGPLPTSLAARARALLADQQDVGRRLAEAAGAGRKQSQLLDSMKFDNASAPVLLDQDG